MRLQQKIFLGFLAFVILPIIILGLVSYQISSSALKEKVGRETLQTLQGIDLTLQMVVSEVIR